MSVYLILYTLNVRFFYVCDFVEDHDDEVEDQVEFSYKEGSKKGPSKWGELHKEWKTCKIGKMQSPIDISSCGIKKKRKLGHKKLYKPSNSTLRNRGHDISVSC